MIGKTIGMDAESYKKFVSLSKEEQVNKVYNMLSPKNMEQAEELLKHVPNGDNISKGSPKPSKADNTASDTGNSTQRNTSRSSTDSGKSK